MSRWAKAPLLWARSVACTVFAIVAIGCGSPSEADWSPTGAAAQPLDVIFCGRFPTLKADGTTRWEREWYVVPAMNAKLRSFPDFAASVGFQTVSNCDEARTVMDRYEEYSSRNPHFDFEQPLEPGRLWASDRPYPPIVPRVPKILNGTGDTVSPVVHLSFLDTLDTAATPGTCTGTFLTKHWIATAAHCLFQGEDHTVTPTFATVNNRYTKLQVAFGTTSGVRGPIKDLDVLQFPDEKYMGYRKDWGGVTDDFDFALLFVPPDNDTATFANADDFGLTQGPAMRLHVDPDSVLFRSPPVAVQYWGWGLPVDPQHAPDPLSRRANAHQLGPFTRGGPGIFSAPLPANYSGATPCKGDSGGPMIRMVPIGGVDRPTILGTLSGFNPPNQPGDCPRAPGTTYKWVSMKEEKDFITKAMRTYYGGGDNGTVGFSCKPVSEDGGVGGNVVRQCWGAPCTSDDTGPKCGANEACYKAAAEFRGFECTVCGNAGCACIVGQCIRKD